MFDVTFEVHGLNITLLAEETLPKMEQELIEKLASFGVFAMYSEAPYKTGLTANTIHKQIGDLTAVIGPSTPYAPYIEFGTRPHIIEPRGMRSLKFVVGGNTIFSKLVHHPGTRPNPFVARTAALIQQEIPTVFTELWQTTLQETQQ